jgi:squalene-associated FAD-dependent desaturase
MRLDDPALDTETFGAWLARHGQSPGAIAGLWDLITVATINLPAAEASLMMAAKVFQTGLLTDRSAADIGLSRIPLGRLHGERAAAALARAGVTVHTATRVTAIEATEARFVVHADGGAWDADAVVAALPHFEVNSLLPGGALPRGDQLERLGTSAIVDVHLLFDRHVTDLPLLAGIDTAAQWVFDRTASSGLDPDGPQQYLAVSLSAADHLLGRHPDDLAAWVRAELARLLPAVASAEVLDTLVTKERTATFRAVPGTAELRPGPRTTIPGLAVAGAWTDTGWPATMEGAVRSGRAAAHYALVAAGWPRANALEVA